ncbi:DgyrCDS12849 [Dimorphilus gyrociliatus]|uniref:E2 NEDD8-conjugating enzyme n=1 Tax=Dimorphilus gyrociliatus TaxID=2664684 RepID=A0A7I8W8X2_9ANNE|nr:DgyrCDS12849 [Dimorphilus gyrociliatus]
MFNLQERARQQKDRQRNGRNRATLRDKLLLREVPALQKIKPTTCDYFFEDQDALHNFFLHIKPTEGPWRDGLFKFEVTVPDDYNMKPPKVKCHTKIWHPNINETGEVCLSLLREVSVDGMGWAPTRSLTDVVLGLNSLFNVNDLVNFNDPLNTNAADQYHRDKDEFTKVARDYVHRFAKKR